MKATETSLPGVLLLEPQVFGDERGWFYESWNKRDFDTAVGRSVDFVQDNHSRSVRGVLRGLHYQLPNPQAKLVRCTVGAIWDVAVDIRRSSDHFGRWFGTELSAENRRQLWIPEGFAHGFLTLSDVAEVAYKATAFYDPQADRSIRCDDPQLGIEWPQPSNPSLMSTKDRAAPPLPEAVTFH